MNQAQFQKQLVAILRKATAHPKQATKLLLALHKKARRAARSSVSERDAQDSLGFAALLLSRSGSHATALKLEKEVIGNYQAEMRNVGHALANSIARAALLSFKLGRIAEGRKLAYEALEYFGRFPEPSYLIEQLGVELKKHGYSKNA